MALYFYERGLRYENGVIALIPYRQILEECLREPFETLSVSSIIFTAIKRITGMRVIKKKYHSSLLYQWLERRICQNPAYIQAKEIRLQEEATTRRLEKEYRKKVNNSRGYNMQLDYILKQKARLNSRNHKDLDC